MKPDALLAPARRLLGVPLRDWGCVPHAEGESAADDMRRKAGLRCEVGPLPLVELCRPLPCKTAQPNCYMQQLSIWVFLTC